MDYHLSNLRHLWINAFPKDYKIYPQITQITQS